MVASSSNFMLLRSTSTNNISGMSTGNLKDMVMLKTVAPTAAPAAALSSKNGAGFSSIKTCNKKKNKCLSDGNLQNLLSVLKLLDTMAPTAAAALSNKNGADFSSIKSSNNNKKNKCLSGENLKNLLYVLETTVVPPP
eukprot:CAMPEP_0170972802 /NCGR_PEP_ID=MMETSP0735-20130129/46258_1 /TAXON_ID=186038 /ORGANISM="Fragilariopsis kerguelensis, Strain L26-C5" /LENGTH=137 /DNA_ID=CAMNT_0011393467 /DNA_START=115 /DNA_END=526 /DNA_ORIENTATION=+